MVAANVTAKVTAMAVAVAAVAAGMTAGPWTTGRPGDIPAAHAQAAVPRLVSHVAGSAAAADADSLNASLSADGRWVAFESVATDLAAPDADTAADVFVHDRATDRAERVSRDAAGAEVTGRVIMPALAAGGGWVAFRSAAALTADPAPWGGLYVRELATGAVQLVVADTNGGRGASYAPAISADGGRVVFESIAALAGAPADGRERVFVWDRASGALRPVSPLAADAPARDPAISDDGRVVAFASEAANLVAGPAGTGAQVYAVDLSMPDRLARVSVATGGAPGDGASGEPALSGDGRIVAFASLAANLVTKDVNAVADIFVHDRQTGETVAIGDVTPADDVHHPGASTEPDLSPNGRFLAFTSAMYTLTPGDTNWLPDVYVHDRQARSMRLVSRKADGSQSDDRSWGPAVADTGAVAFVSAAALAPGDAGGHSDVYYVGAGDDPHPHASPTATVVHRPTWTPTIVHRPTWTPTPDGHHPTPTSVHHPTATPGGHHPTATPESTGGRVLPISDWRVWLPAVLWGGG